MRRENYMQRDMKLILALFLCGVAYATASPTCSESELDKCSSYTPVTDDEDYKATDEYLNAVCKSMGCMKDYKSRCGVEYVGDYYKSMLVQAEKIHRAMCGTDSQALRRKYKDNIKCMNRVTKYSRDECSIGEMIEFGDPDYCPRIKESLDCTSDLIGRECGNDAREVNNVLAPGLEFHGCKE